MPNQDQIIEQLLDRVALLKRATSGTKLTAAEALDCLDFLRGVEAALPAHPHFGYAVFECARELSAKTAVAAAE